MTTSILILTALMVLFTVRAIWRMLLGARLILPQGAAGEAPATEPLNLLVVLPVLRERLVIHATLAHMEKVLGMDTRAVIAVCGSISERSGAGARNPTEDEVRRIADTVNRRLGRRFIVYFEYPYAGGLMAHQVNWAARYAFDAFDEPVDPRSTIVLLYNADSRPTQQSFDSFRQLFAQGENAAQQISLYVPFQRTKGLFHVMACAAAVWQTRWSLGVEAPRLHFAYRVSRSYALFGSKGGQLVRALVHPNNYVIGHGLAVRLSTFVETNYLPQSVRNEDAAAGFVFAASNVRIAPAGGCDTAEVPRSLSSLFFQQVGWFCGPADAPRYYELSKRLLGPKHPGLFAFILALKVLYDAAAWVVGPTIFLFAIVAATLDVSWLPFVAGVLGYLVFPSLVLWGRRLPAPWLGRGDFLCGVAALPLFYVLHGCAGAWWLTSECALRMRGGQVPKYKTERE